MEKIFWSVGWGIIVLILIAGQAVGGSFEAPSLGARATGMAGAYVAIADDPMAIYWNPAGLSQVEDNQIMLGNTLVKGYAHYETEDGERENNLAQWQPIPHVAFSLPVGEKFALGAGFYSPFGLKQRWHDDSAYRYNSTSSQIQLTTFQAAASWSLRDNFALGCALGRDWAKLNAKSFLQISPIISDGYMKLSGEDEGFSGSIGFLWKVNPLWSIGGVWRSESKVDFEGDLDWKYPEEFSVFGLDRTESDYRMKFTFPQSLSLGVSYKPSDRWLLAAQTDWVKWSSIKEITLKLDEPILVSPVPFPTYIEEVEFTRDWKDTCRFRVGGEYKVNDNLRLRFGYMWDPSPVPSETLDPLMFDVSVHRYSLGLGYQFGTWELNAAYMYSQGVKKEAEDSENIVSGLPLGTSGDYWGTSHVVELTLTYHF